ncbi:hypothetical protein HBN82_18850 [Pseudomonas lundensis]|uniref:hypothetical protein n=1 Tax=Pseudomonas lundensis TaxID=86185 RepID=UPI0014764CAF|nr:hypothetical protein [Pseudomonas lundensis]NNA17917.1 hypothetical protein [Pseudomonas lundensis]
MNNVIDDSKDPQLLNASNDRIRTFLNKQLEGYGLDCGEVYINIVDDPVTLELVSSESLLEVGFTCLVQDREPTYVQGLTQAFSKPWTFDEADRIRKPSLYDIEKIMRKLQDEAKYQWSR